MERAINPYYYEKLNTYYADNAKKLYKKVDKILTKFGGVSNKDYDYFYVVASDLFTAICLEDSYDPQKGDFDKFLSSCLLSKIKSEMTKRNREKRKADRMSVSIDKAIGEDETITIGDTIADDFDMEKEILGEEDRYSQKMILYLSKLSNLQKEVLKLNAEGYIPKEIREKLHINEKQYSDCYAAIRSYKNTKCIASLIRRKSENAGRI